AEVVEAVRAADLIVANLECCISTRGRRWPAAGKPFFFRAPPSAVELLALLGVGCVTLANNHALDFGAEALLDTLEHLAAAGIRAVGAGPDLDQAPRPAVLEAAGTRLAVVGVSDHPADYAAGPRRPGIAFAPPLRGVPAWLPPPAGRRGGRRGGGEPALGTEHDRAPGRPRPPCRQGPHRRRGDPGRRALGARVP